MNYRIAGFHSQKYPVCHLLVFPVTIIFMTSAGTKNTALAYTATDNTYACNRWRYYNILHVTYKVNKNLAYFAGIC